MWSDANRRFSVTGQMTEAQAIAMANSSSVEWDELFLELPRRSNIS